MSDYEVVNVSSATEVTNPTENETFVAFNSSTIALEKIKYGKLAKSVIESYSGSTLAGSRRSVQSAVDTLYQSVNELSVKTDSLGNGAPIPVSTVAEMTDTTNVYLYTGNETGYVAGNWYFYDGSAWTSGGVYGDTSSVIIDNTLSVSGQAADSKTVGDRLDALEDDLASIEDDIISVAVNGTGLVIS